MKNESKISIGEASYGRSADSSDKITSTLIILYANNDKTNCMEMSC